MRLKNSWKGRVKWLRPSSDVKRTWSLEVPFFYTLLTNTHLTHKAAPGYHVMVFMISLRCKFCHLDPTVSEMWVRHGQSFALLTFLPLIACFTVQDSNYIHIAIQFYKSQSKTALNPTLMPIYLRSRNIILELVVFVTSRRVRSILPSKQNPLVNHTIELYGHKQWVVAHLVQKSQR